MPQSFASLNAHLVFSTKHRRPQIDDAWSERLFSVIGGTLRTTRCCLLAAGGMPDHVHLVASLASDLSVSEVVRNVKTASSSWVHEEIGVDEFQWQTGYSAFSLGISMLDDTRTYLARQRKHHAKRSYQDEVRAFLRRHGLEPDEEHMRV